MDLPDVNIWLALIDENHSLHASARRYWEEDSSTPKAFCRITMLGFVRLGTQPRILSGVLTSQEAWALYREFLAHPLLSFIPEPEDIEVYLSAFTDRPFFPGRLWTDAYLAAFAISAGCRLVSFDSDFASFSGLSLLHLPPP